MKVDVSEVEWGDWYKDEKCKEMEEVLQSDLRYAECEVRRARWEEEINDDPFYVLDEKRTKIIMLQRWEVYALSGSELISYVNVQRWREQVSSRLMLLCGLLLLPGLSAVGCLIVAPIFSYLGEYESFSVAIDWAVSSGAILLFTGLLAYLLYRYTESRKRMMDLETVAKDPPFLDALRRVAEAAEVDKHRKQMFVKRVKHLEDALAGINS